MLGAILAGGASARFGGEPKGLYRIGGERIIDRVAAAMRSVTDELIVISNTPEAPHWLDGVPAFADSRTERGSVVGIHTALMHARDYALVVAWDMPFVTASLFALIVERASRSPYAAVPESGRGLEPLCAAYSVRCLPFVEAAIDASDFRLSALLERLPSCERIPQADVARLGDSARLFMNVNSVADLSAAEHLTSEH
jgi:molybdopterin-guanine dinucleotide biosynthesis protein A